MKGIFLRTYKTSNISKIFIASASACILLISACSTGGSTLFSNQAKPYIYSPEEKKATLGAPSAQVGATGEISYCNAGLTQLIEARRSEALSAISAVCGGEESYYIKGEGDGSVNGRYVGNFKLTPSCTRGRIIWFKCKTSEPKYDRTK
jgi:hypothetical protein